MTRELESPYVEGAPQWDSLYRARDDEVAPTRPVFTGDVFSAVPLPGRTGKVKDRTVIVLHHPCSMRTNGVDLAWQLLTAEVTPRKEISEADWAGGFFNLMPLPALRPGLSSQALHQAADFDALYMVQPQQLVNRIACLSQFGVNLLLQRWVHYSSRVIVPTYLFQEQTVAHYEEADLLEEWCDEVNSGDPQADAQACMNWLRSERDGPTYQELLANPQSHSTVRKAMRAALKNLTSPRG